MRKELGIDLNRLGPYELNTIVTGDARILAEAIPDNSVDLIFTDPDYTKISDYEWLARTAARVLKPDRALLVWFGVGDLPLILDALRAKGLIYRWLFEFVLIGTPMFYGSIGVKSQKFLWFDKGKSSLSRMVLDVTMINSYLRPGKNNSKVWHDSDRGSAKLKGGLTDWGKDIDGTARFITAFTQPGDIVADFFCGGGTVPAVAKMSGVNYWACEIEPETAARARQRVLLTQPPLFVMSHPELVEGQPAQPALFGGGEK